MKKFFLLLSLFLSLGNFGGDKEEKIKFFNFGERKIYFFEDGEGGIPIIFIHGLGGDHTLFKYQIDHFRKSRKVVAIDLYGHYKSTPIKVEDYSIKEFAQSVVELINYLKIEKCVVSGHSMGATVAIEVANLIPKKVLSLIFLDPAGNIYNLPSERKKAMIENLKAQTGKDFVRDWFTTILNKAKDNTKKMVFEALEKVPKEVLLGEYIALTRYDLSEPLMGYNGNILLINRPESKSNLSYLRINSKIEVHTLLNVSHWLMIDHPYKVNNIMEDFLKRKGI